MENPNKNQMGKLFIISILISICGYSYDTLVETLITGETHPDF